MHRIKMQKCPNETKIPPLHSKCCTQYSDTVLITTIRSIQLTSELIVCCIIFHNRIVSLCSVIWRNLSQVPVEKLQVYEFYGNSETLPLQTVWILACVISHSKFVPIVSLIPKWNMQLHMCNEYYMHINC